MALYIHCVSCMLGDHGGHVAKSGHRSDPNICKCAGDCAEVLAKHEARLSAQYEQAEKERIKAAVELLRSNGYTVTKPTKVPVPRNPSKANPPAKAGKSMVKLRPIPGVTV